MKLPAKVLLFVSPYESPSSKWEVKQFDSYEEAWKEVGKCDYTKELFVYSIDEIIPLLRIEAEKYEASFPEII